MSPYIAPGIRLQNLRLFVANQHIARDPDISKAIIRMVCTEMSVRSDEVVSRSHKRVLTSPRQICCYFLRKKTKLSYKTIGKMMSGRDHSTIIYSRETVEELIDTDRAYRRVIINIENLIDEELALIKLMQQ